MARGKQKIQAQEKNAKLQQKLKKQAAKKAGGGAAVKNALTCKICFATVIGNALKRTKLEEHHGAKHAKLSLYKCFPSIDPSVIAASASSASASAAPQYKPDKVKKAKKGKKSRKGP